ncbi:MAG: C1 family peptidase [Leptospirales bacterium]|nr:C1 family peptidase [Leptospirales bacterium]
MLFRLLPTPKAWVVPGLVARHRRALIILVILLVCSSCMIQERLFKDPPRVLQLEDFPIEPNYTAADKKVPILLAGKVDNPPKMYKLPGLPVAGNQGKQASGVAWAVGYLAAGYFFNTKEGMLTFTCSPAFLYNNLNNGKDEGIEVARALQFLKDTGCAEERTMPYNELDPHVRPGSDAFTSAAAHRIRGYARIDYRDLEQVRAHLLQGSAVIVSLKITDNFVELSKPVWVPAGEFVAIHTVAVVGYDIITGEMILQNSAGPGWGKDGQARLSFSWFQRLTEKAFVLF